MPWKPQVCTQARVERYCAQSMAEQIPRKPKLVRLRRNWVVRTYYISYYTPPFRENNQFKIRLRLKNVRITNPI